MNQSAIIGRSKESGHAIVKLTDVPATMREGSANAKYFGLILKSAISDEAADKIRKLGNDKPWDIVRLAIKRGVIRLGKKVAMEAPAKVAKAPAAKAKKVAAAKPAKVAKAPKVKADPKPRAPRKPRGGDRRGTETVL